MSISKVVAGYSRRKMMRNVHVDVMTKNLHPVRVPNQ